MTLRDMIDHALQVKDAIRAVAYLRGWVDQPMPVMVTIGKRAYPGVRYVRYGKGVVYLLGQLPAWRYKRNVLYSCEGHAWYLPHYSDEQSMAPQFKQYHALGHHFGLFQSDNNLGPHSRATTITIQEV